MNSPESKSPESKNPESKSPKSESPELKNRYDAIAFQVNREDELLSKRLTWCLTINGFLFAAIGLISNASKNKPTIKAVGCISDIDNLTVEVINIFTYAVPCIGVAVSVAALFGVIAANLQILDLRKAWRDLDNPPWVRPFGKGFAFALGWVTPLIPAVALVIAWSIILKKMYY